MTRTEHILALVDGTPAGESTLDLARAAVERGGRATLIMMLTPRDVRGIREFAEAEDLTLGEAESVYLDRAERAYREHVGDANLETVVAYQPTAKDVMVAASTTRATTLAIPQSIAIDRRWRSQLKRTSLPVVIAPNRAA